MPRQAVRVMWWGMWLALLAACGGPAPPAAPPAAPPPTEAELVERLLLELDPTDTPEARERNALVNYAIDHGWAVQAHPRGFFYEIVAPGQPPLWQWGESAQAHYRGSFLDGRVFDDSRQRGRPLVLVVGNLIPAWNEALQLVGRGGQLRLLCPSATAYGQAGLVAAPGDTLVPPGMSLVFELEVWE